MSTRVTQAIHVSVGRSVGQRRQPARWPVPSGTVLSEQRQTGSGPVSSAHWPVRSGNVPPLAQRFVPRAETGFDLASLALGETAVLAPSARPDMAGAAGMGGTGKTQLAAALARSLFDSGAVQLLAWVPAASRDSLITGYAQAAAAAAVPGVTDAPEAAAASFVAWLAKTSRPWLVVLDDLADLADLDELWPRGPAGRAVVTSRLPAAAVRGPGRRILEVGPFSPREALSYLTASLYADQRTRAIDLATELGHLPLGLAQASAVIADAGIDCGQYRTHLADRTQHMSVLQADRHAAIVAATWSISLDRADSTSPSGMARPALAFIALLDSGGIPGAVLSSRAAWDYICGRGATGTPADESQVHSVLDRLARVGLVTIDPESASRTVGMHTLCQTTARQVIPPAMLKEASQAAASALLQAWPQGDRDPLVAQALRDCTASLHQAADDLLWTPEVHPVLLRAGRCLDRARLPSLAITYWRAIVGTGSRILGPGHASTLLARDRLAAACEAAGRPQDAAAALENSVTERERALGQAHPETLSTRGSLADAHLAAGRSEDAISLYESTLADQERVLGPYHPDTMTARGHLAVAYRSAGRLQDAVSALQRTLRDREAVLGPEDPETMTACADLAATLHASGQVADAIPLYERALADRERVLGPDHPDTMTARASVAYAYRSADRLGEALPVYQQTLADRERVLGPDHPDTMTSLANLAWAYHTARNLKQAIPLYERILADRERLMGPDHPDTLAARGNLGSGYHSAGRITLAIPLYEQTLHDCERLMGPDHTSTLTSRANLASAYHTMGRLTEAVALFEHTLADCEQYLPPDHPMTQAIRENLEAAW
jgi:tetratricopeptide (TPR) repeat protein